MGKEKFPAVSDVSFGVNAGEIHALLGPNGAGKTTTVKCCATLLAPSGGKVIVSGVDVAKNPRKARKDVGLVLGGELGFYPRVSARNNLLFFADIAGIGGKERHRQVAEKLELVDLADRADDKVEAFSRGMRQRLHIARALLGNPKLLLLDEPTSGLDPEIALQVRTVIAQVADQDIAVLLTSHLMPEIEKLADKITIIGAGKTYLSGGLEDVKTAALKEFAAQNPGVAQPHSFTLEDAYLQLASNLVRA
ncbi:MAG: ABC transporter ATP-binding protein [Actinomycetaceae bacterium]|nr:ABC transporter ATP-binding protein [Actinomycetaceae bacterium]